MPRPHPLAERMPPQHPTKTRAPPRFPPPWPSERNDRPTSAHATHQLGVCLAPSPLYRYVMGFAGTHSFRFFCCVVCLVTLCGCWLLCVVTSSICFTVALTGAITRECLLYVSWQQPNEVRAVADEQREAELKAGGDRCLMTPPTVYHQSGWSP